MIDAVLSWIAQTALSTCIRRSDWDVMALEAAHLLGLALLFGSANIFALAALRRNGLGGLQLATLTSQLRRAVFLGLALMAISGSLIAISIPRKYYLNQAFRAKMLLLVLAVAATVWLLRRAAAGGSALLPRVLALVSWLLWLGVGICGRLIGFL